MLVGYFGETLPGPCGHCTACLSGFDAQTRALPADAPLPSLASLFDVSTFEQLCAAHPGALGEPRQQARFLCGLSSPALTAARLSRDPLFGACEHYPFAEVLAWLGGDGDQRPLRRAAMKAAK
jgi:ATP-dependent DNA helicase RecQ